MKKTALFYFFTFITLLSYSQATSVSATYSSGDINSDPNFNNLPGTSACPGTLSVTVPVGALVTGVDVTYDMTSVVPSNIFSQRSWLRCITTGNDEAAITSGPSIFTPGTQSYNRSNLNIANGVTSTTTLDFEMHSGFFGFGACNSSTVVDNNTWVITVHYLPAGSCTPPSLLSSSNLQTTSVDLSWTTGGATNWDIKYGSTGFDPALAGTLVSTTTNPHTLTGLTQNTTYDIYVRDNCGTGNESFWLGPINVTTPCAVVTAPYMESFDVSPLSACWTNTSSGTLWQTTDGTGFPSPNGGASGVADHTGNGGFYAWGNGGFPAINNQRLVSPFIDASGITNPYLRFYVFSNNIFTPGDNVTLTVDFHDGTAWNNAVATYSGDDPNWVEVTADLSSYTITGNVRLRFTNNQTTSTNPFQNDLLIDDIELISAPNCAKPLALSGSNATNTSIDLSWVTGGATDWQIEYGPVGFAHGTGTIIATSTNPFTVTGLNPATTYDFYVRDSCGLGDVSFWDGPFTTNTTCGTSVAPYFETFSTNSTPACWNNPGNPNWLFGNGSGFPSPGFGAATATDHTGNGGFFAWTDAGFPVGNNILLRSPLIDVSPLTVPYLTYWTFSNNTNNPGDNVTLTVQMYDGTAWVVVDTYSGDNAGWLEHGVDLSSFVIAGNDIRVRFTVNQTTATTPFFNDFLLDDISIEEAPSCIKPSSLISTGVVTNTSVEVDWTTGGATAWQIEYGPTGFTNGSGTIVGTTTKPHIITGLSANTTYDFYVRDSCGAGDVSDWLGPITVATLCNPFTAPFTESFDNASTPTCWNNFSTAGPTWLFSNGTGFPAPMGGAAGINEHTGNGGFFAWSDGSAFPQSNDVTLESPLIDVSSLTTPFLSFWVFSNNTNNPGDNVTLTVDVFDGAAWNNALITYSADDAAWQELTYNLSLLTITGPIRLRIKNDVTTSGVPFFNDFLLDDIEIDEAPNCPKPLNLTASNPTPTTVDLSWTTGGATNWQIEYGSAGFTQGSGTIVAVLTNPFTVTGLSSSTTYDFYLRDSCGVGDVSDWIGPITFTTQCVVASAPFTEDFDNASWTSGINFNNANDGINTCWSRTHTAPYFWGTRAGASPSSFNTGPTVDNTLGTAAGKYIYTESTTAINGAITEIESPDIDLSTLTTPELRFWYHMFGNTMGTLRVDIWDGSTWTNGAFTLTGQQQTATTAPWLEAIVNIQAYANDTIRVRFTATNGGFSSDIAIDDFTILEAPNCPQPSLLNASNPTATSIDLDWTTGGATNWQIEYGPSGFTQGSGTIVAVSTNPFTVTGLSSSTTYDFYLRDSCGVGDVSVWIGPVSFTTQCLVASAPFTESFDNTTWTSGINFNNANDGINTCWSRTHTVPYFWGTRSGATPSFTTGPTVDNTLGTAGKYIYTESTTAPNGAITQIESPDIDLSTLTVPELRFWYHMFGNTMGTLRVDIWDGSTWTNGAFTLTGQQQTTTTAPWLEAIVNIQAYANDTIRVRFTATNGGFGSDIAVDDFSVDEAPNCPQPTNLTSTGTSVTSVDLSWLSGGASNWQIEYGPTGFAQGLGTIVAASTNPFTVTGLSASTTYDFYVRDSCGVGDVSVWIGPLSVTTTCAVASAPFTENFDNTTWTSGTGFNNINDAINTCWSRTHTAPYFWGTRAGATQSFGTGPTVDNTLGTAAGKYIYTESTTAPNGAITQIESPPIDLSTLTVPELRFWYHMFGNTMGTLRVDIWDGSTWTNGVSTITGQQQTATTDAWLEQIVNIQAYANDTIRVRFTATNGGFNSDIAVDDFTVLEAPSCPKPSNIVATGETDVSIDVSWLSGGASNWQIEYGPTGFTPGSGTIIAVSTNPFTITGLTAATTYDIYIRDSCGVADVSEWEGPLTHATDICATPCTYTIDMTDTFGDGWNGGSVDIQVGGVTTNFTIVAGNSASGTFQVCTGLAITATWNPGTFDNEVGFVVRDFSGAIVHTQGGNPPTNVFTATGDCGSATCPSPSAVIASNPTVNSVDLSWTTGGATNWQIEYGPAGFTPGSGTIIAANTNPFTVTGLSSSTSYDFYVRDSCGVGDVSVFVGPITFNTTCTPVSIPFIEDFEGTPWVSGTGLNNLNDAIEGCWQRNRETPHFWGTRQGFVGTTANTGPDADHTLGSAAGKYIYTEASGGVNAQLATIETPPIDLSTALLPELKFWYFMFGNQITSLTVDVWDGSMWTNGVFSISGQQQTNSLSPWDSAVVDLSPYIGDTIIIRFGNARGVGFTCDVAIDDINISETSTCLLPTPDFTFIITGSTVDFDANTSTNGVSYSWDYDDGSANGSGITSSNTYANGGTYDVTLIVTGPCGDIDSITKPVNVPCAATVASFTNASSGLGLDVDASTSTNAVSWMWDYGDGNSGSGSIANHNYAIDGTYIIKLVTENLCGDKDSTTTTLTLCDTNFTASFTNIIFGDTLNVNAGGVANATSWSWDFGDGTGTGADSTESYVYTTPGIYDVKLVVENLCGVKDSIIKSIEICGPPTAHFTADVQSIVPGSMVVNFDGTQSTTGTLTYTWDFGDGSTPVTGPAKPQHTYTTPNLNFQVTLTVTNSCGDESILTQTIGQAISVTELELIEQSVSIYPNPSDGRFNIDIVIPESSRQDIQINVINALGQVMHLEMIPNVSGSTTESVDISNQPSGVYILQIVTTTGVINKRITLQ